MVEHGEQIQADNAGASLRHSAFAASPRKGNGSGTAWCGPAAGLGEAGVCGVSSQARQLIGNDPDITVFLVDRLSTITFQKKQATLRRPTCDWARAAAIGD